MTSSSIPTQSSATSTGLASEENQKGEILPGLGEKSSHVWEAIYHGPQATPLIQLSTAQFDVCNVCRRVTLFEANVRLFELLTVVSCGLI